MIHTEYNVYKEVSGYTVGRCALNRLYAIDANWRHTGGSHLFGFHGVHKTTVDKLFTAARSQGLVSLMKQ